MEAAKHLAKVFIVEDSPAIRERLVRMLSDKALALVVGQADSAAAASAEILRIRPDCVVLDIHLLGSSGMTVLKEVHPQAPEIVFIVLTNHSSTQYRRMCMTAGASYFFDKNTEVGKVREVIASLPSIDNNI